MLDEPIRGLVLQPLVRIKLDAPSHRTTLASRRRFSQSDRRAVDKDLLESLFAAEGMDY